MRARLADLLPRLDERDRRVAMATEAKSWGRGGISAVYRATGASRSTIRRGITELDGDDQRFSSSAPAGRRPQEGRADQSRTAGKFGFTHRAGNPRGSRVAAAVDHEVD